MWALFLFCCIYQAVTSALAALAWSRMRAAEQESRKAALASAECAQEHAALKILISSQAAILAEKETLAKSLQEAVAAKRMELESALERCAKLEAKMHQAVAAAEPDADSMKNSPPPSSTPERWRSPSALDAPHGRGLEDRRQADRRVPSPINSSGALSVPPSGLRRRFPRLVAASCGILTLSIALATDSHRDGDLQSMSFSLMAAYSLLTLGLGWLMFSAVTPRLFKTTAHARRQFEGPSSC
jgi:hypothetical protein